MPNSVARKNHRTVSPESVVDSKFGCSVAAWIMGVSRLVFVASVFVCVSYCRSIMLKDMVAVGSGERWKRVRALRCWWQSMDSDGQADWYRKQHVLSVGAKRAFGQVELEEGSTVQIGTEEQELDHYQPWWMFRDQRSCCKPAA